MAQGTRMGKPRSPVVNPGRALLARLLFNLVAYACGVALSRLLRAGGVYEQPWWVAVPVVVVGWGGLLVCYLAVSSALAKRGMP